jgi:hypothetical protein
MAATQTRGISASVGIPDKGIWCDARGVTGNAGEERILIMFFQSLMSGRLLSEGSLKKMFSDMHLMTVTQSTYYGRGIVAALGTPVGDIIGHTGGIQGFGASLFYHPGENIFVCVMMNDDIRAVDPAMFRLMEAMMGR